MRGVGVGGHRVIDEQIRLKFVDLQRVIFWSFEEKEKRRSSFPRPRRMRP